MIIPCSGGFIGAWHALGCEEGFEEALGEFAFFITGDGFETFPLFWELEGFDAKTQIRADRRLINPSGA